MASTTSLGNNKYKIFVELGYNDNGKRIRKTKTVTAKSDRALKKAITAFELEVANTRGLDSIENITFAKFVDRWLNMYVRPKLSIKSRDTYTSYLNNGILDYFGDMKINKIKTYHIEEFFALNPKAQSGKYMALKSIFAKAESWEVIVNNPTKKVSKPQSPKKQREFEFYDEKQLKHLLKTLDGVYPKHRVIIKLAALVGLRRAEIAGIRMECLNYKDNTILIDKTLIYDKEGKTFVLAPTKTKKPRTVNVPKTFMKEIKEYEKERKKIKLACGNVWDPLMDADGKPVNLLFTNKTGYPTHINSISNEWRKIITRHKLPNLNFHGLRHTCASFLLSRGANFKIIQEQLGHTDIRETINRYSHLTEEGKVEAINLFEDIL